MDYIEFEKRYMEFTNKHDHVLWDKRESLGLFLDKVFVIDDGESIPQKEEDWDLGLLHSIEKDQLDTMLKMKHI